MIRLLLLAYPAAWRRRYGDELAQLVTDSGLGLTVALDLVRRGFVERGRAIRSSLAGGTGMSIGPAYRHPAGLAVAAMLILLPTLLFVVGSILAYQLGVASLHPPMDAANRWLAGSRLADMALMLAPVVALLLAVLPMVQLKSPGPGTWAGKLCWLFG